MGHKCHNICCSHILDNTYVRITFPEECRPFQIIRYTTTHDRNNVPTSSQLTAPKPLARPTNKVPFVPIDSSKNGSFFLSTRCLQFIFVVLVITKCLKYQNKGQVYLHPKLLHWGGCSGMMLFMVCHVIHCVIWVNQVIGGFVITFNETRIFIPPSIYVQMNIYIN